MNPATRERKRIANEPKLSFDREGLAYGFGFDPKTEDYKLLRVTVRLPGVTNIADVFSLTNNSWRLVADSVLEGVEVDDMWSRVVVKNVVHWCGILKEETGFKPKGIGGFDLVYEVFKDIIRIPLSLKSRENCYCVHRCCVVKECLSLAAMFENDHSIELWVMKEKEYGVEGSWTKLCLFHVLQHPRRWLSTFEVGFNGMALVHEDRCLLVMRPSSSVGDFDIVFDGHSFFFDGCYVNYRENLVQTSQD